MNGRGINLGSSRLVEAVEWASVCKCPAIEKVDDEMTLVPGYMDKNERRQLIDTIYVLSEIDRVVIKRPVLFTGINPAYSALNNLVNGYDN